MSDFPSQLEVWSTKVSKLVVQAETKRAAYSQAKRDFNSINNKLAHIKTAQAIAQLVAQTIQEKAHAKMSSVVSRCLSAVFENPYQFKILFEKKRGRTEAVLIFERDGHQITDPMNGSGGGCIDVAGFALRLSSLMLQRPNRRRTIVLDEPFKSPSPAKNYRDRTKQLIEVLSEEMGIQFVMITNIMELATGDIIDLETE